MMAILVECLIIRILFPNMMDMDTQYRACLPRPAPWMLLPVMCLVRPWLFEEEKAHLGAASLCTLRIVGSLSELRLIRRAWLDWCEWRIERAVAGISDEEPSSDEGFPHGFYIDSDGHWHETDDGELSPDW